MQKLLGFTFTWSSSRCVLLAGALCLSVAYPLHYAFLHFLASLCSFLGKLNWFQPLSKSPYTSSFVSKTSLFFGKFSRLRWTDIFWKEKIEIAFSWRLASILKIKVQSKTLISFTIGEFGTFAIRVKFGQLKHR